MARWLVRLEGDQIDLKEYPRWFPDGEVFAIEKDGEFFLIGPGLEALPDADVVLNEAKDTLNSFTATILLFVPNIKKPTIDAVIRERDNGKREGYVSVSARIELRGNVIAEGSVEPRSVSPQSTQAQELLKKATGKPHLEQALLLWGDPVRTWPRLYRVLEEIERQLEKQVNEAGCCSGKERERFTRTANSAEAAGKDARHASGKFMPPPNPMTLEEGTRFISRMIVNAIQQVCTFT